MLLLIDMKSRRVQEDQGEPLFVARGEPSPYLLKINTIMNQLLEGTRACNAFLTTLDQHGLIEPIGLDVDFANGQSSQLNGLFAVSESKEKALPRTVLRELHANRYLELIYMMRASHAHISTLIRMKNQRLNAD
jgi:hypothetical protein